VIFGLALVLLESSLKPLPETGGCFRHRRIRCGASRRSGPLPFGPGLFPWLKPSSEENAASTGAIVQVHSERGPVDWSWPPGGGPELLQQPLQILTKLRFSFPEASEEGALAAFTVSGAISATLRRNAGSVSAFEFRHPDKQPIRSPSSAPARTWEVPESHRQGSAGRVARHDWISFHISRRIAFGGPRLSPRRQPVDAWVHVTDMPASELQG